MSCKIEKDINDVIIETAISQGLPKSKITALFDGKGSIVDANELQRAAASVGYYLDVIECFPHLFSDKVLINACPLKRHDIQISISVFINDKFKIRELATEEPVKRKPRKKSNKLT
jgi:hypothetical protein